MNRREAEKLAENVTPEDLKQMFLNARTGIEDWHQVSSVNKGLTKGTAYNVLVKGFSSIVTTNMLAKINMIREFGEYLPGYKKPVQKKKSKSSLVHQEPFKIGDEPDDFRNDFK